MLILDHKLTLPKFNINKICSGYFFNVQEVNVSNSSPVRSRTKQYTVKVHSDTILKNAYKITSDLATSHLSPQFTLIFHC
jgi:hypothetical protein